MNSENSSQIERLYYAALERPPELRAAFLDEVCSGDEGLRRDLESLLASEAQAGTFLAGPIADAMAKAIIPESNLSPLGRQVGRYQILSLLGSGGMGEVYLARDTQLGRLVALKLLPAEFTTEAGRLRRFAQEACAVSALNHPNIITIHEIGESEALHYIVTEYVEGETLRQRMTQAPQQRVPIPNALDLAVQIGAALEAAHRRGITHRDIKPENVMVRRDGIVKVLDFGLAKLTEPEALNAQTFPIAGNSTQPGAIMGTLRYMSPEQVRGEKVDVRSDIFSLGVMLYQMISGRAPFGGSTSSETIAAILRDEPQPLNRYAPAAPAQLERIISRCLRKARTDRYQTARELLADLKELKQRMDLGEKLAATEGPAANISHKPAGFFTPALRAVARWVSPRRQPPLTEKDMILLADFENKTGETVFDGTLKQALSIQLQQSPFLSVLPEERVRQTLGLMKRSADERITSRIAREICVRHNLKALIIGSIAPLGSHYVITLEAIHGQNGEVLENEQVEAKSKERVLRALSQAATRLRARLGESLSSIQQFDIGLEETTTPKLDAFQAYSLGYEQSLRGRLIDAIQLYRRAVEIDPDFAYAWSMLSVHYSVVGHPEVAAEHAERAYTLRDRVSDYEQLQITFRYHFVATGDMNQAINAAILFRRTYPRTSTAPIDLLVAYDLIGQHEQAVAEGREAIRLNPGYAPAYWYLGRALLRVNRFAEAVEIFNEALEQKFDMTNIHSALYAIAFAEGNTVDMQEQLDWATGKPENYVALEWQAATAACSGQWLKAQEFSRRAIDLAGRSGMKEVAARYATEQALRAVVLEDYERARAYAAQGLTIASGRASLPRAALALAICGETNPVESLINEMGVRFPNDTVINSLWLPTIRAALELQRDNAALAIDRLHSTTGYEGAGEFWPQYLRGMAYLKLGESRATGIEFQKILDHRGYAPLSPLYLLAHLGLARSAALAGDTAQKRRALNDLLTLWDKADPDLTILVKAKSELL